MADQLDQPHVQYFRDDGKTGKIARGPQYFQAFQTKPLEIVRRRAWFEGAPAQHVCAGSLHAERDLQHLPLTLHGARSCNYDRHASAESHRADFHLEAAAFGELRMRAATDRRTDPLKILEAHLSCNLMVHAESPNRGYSAASGLIAEGVSKMAMASIS